MLRPIAYVDLVNKNKFEFCYHLHEEWGEKNLDQDLVDKKTPEYDASLKISFKIEVFMDIMLNLSHACSFKLKLKKTSKNSSSSWTREIDRWIQSKSAQCQ